MKIKKENREIIYYDDELNNEFSKAQIKPRVIDEKYKYDKNPIWDFCSFLFQNILSMPIKILHSKIKFKHKFVGKEKLKQSKKTGYFIYANHTQAFEDTFIPSLANYPKRNFLIVNPENISLKGTGWIVEMLGAIPVPSTVEATKNFLKEIEKRISQNHSITIYPEAHIWPFYTGIRNFKSVSFKYPVKLNKPAYSITNTYQTYGKNNNKLKIVSYVDGPFYPNENMNTKQATEKLRNDIYETMKIRSQNNNIEYIKYEKTNKS